MWRWSVAAVTAASYHISQHKVIGDTSFRNRSQYFERVDVSHVLNEQQALHFKSFVATKTIMVKYKGDGSF